MRRIVLLPLLLAAVPAPASASTSSCANVEHERRYAANIVESGLGCVAARGFVLDYLKAGHRHGHVNLSCRTVSWPKVRCTLSHSGAEVGHVDFEIHSTPTHVVNS